MLMLRLFIVSGRDEGGKDFLSNVVVIWGFARSQVSFTPFSDKGDRLFFLRGCCISFFYLLSWTKVSGHICNLAVMGCVVDVVRGVLNTPSMHIWPLTLVQDNIYLYLPLSSGVLYFILYRDTFIYLPPVKPFMCSAQRIALRFGHFFYVMAGYYSVRSCNIGCC